jgi:hypothetical protein
MKEKDVETIRDFFCGLQDAMKTYTLFDTIKRIKLVEMDV